MFSVSSSCFRCGQSVLVLLSCCSTATVYTYTTYDEGGRNAIGDMDSVSLLSTWVVIPGTVRRCPVPGIVEHFSAAVHISKKYFVMFLSSYGTASENDYHSVLVEAGSAYKLVCYDTCGA